jgi:hypothetical protein
MTAISHVFIFIPTDYIYVSYCKYSPFSNFIHKSLGIIFQMAYISTYTFTTLYEAGPLSLFRKDLITFSLDAAKGGRMFPCSDC